MNDDGGDDVEHSSLNTDKHHTIMRLDMNLRHVFHVVFTRRHLSSSMEFMCLPLTFRPEIGLT